MTSASPTSPHASAPAARQGLRRYAWPILVLGVVLAAAWLLAAALVFPSSAGWGYDFQAYLLAAGRLANGAALYTPATVDGPFRPGPFGLYLYAPPLAVVLLPFTTVSVSLATAIWFGARVLLLLAAIALMPARRWVRLVVFIGAVFSEPVLTDLNLGNVSVIVLFLSVVAWRALDRPLESAAVAVSMAVRPTFGLFLGWWLLRRRWRPLLACLIAGIVFILVSLPFVGLSAYADYLRMVRNLSDVTGVLRNQDLGSGAAALGLGPGLTTVALLAGYAIAVGAALLSLRRDAEVSFVVTLGATLLLSPLLWDHYLVSALIPAAFLLERGGRRGSLAAVILLVALVPAFGVPLIAVAATLAPFLAPPRRPADYPAAVPVAAAGVSKRTTSPA